MNLISTMRHHIVPELKFDQDTVFHVYDNFHEDELERTVALHGQPKYIVNDHYSFIELQNLTCYTVPLYIARESESHCNFQPLPPENRHIFNFVVNKKLINRFLCMKFVEWFKLTDYDYTWSGVGRHADLDEVLKELPKTELPNNMQWFIMSPVVMEKKFKTEGEEFLRDGSHIDSGDHHWTWYNVLQPIFTYSAVSLITESLDHQRGAVFTEKTAYALLGLTFPIWVGCYQQADEFRRMGFDVFDDIINHSYQHRPTLIERCYYAFADNLELLSNRERTFALRQELMPRLLKNRELLLNGQVNRYIENEIGAWPADLQQVMPEIFRIFGNLNILTSEPKQ
jgi:hypothetical protein